MADGKQMNEELKQRIEQKRLRKRKRLDHVLSTQTIMILYVVILLIALFLLVVPRSKVSKIEKRDLTKLPKISGKSIISGEFARGLQSYYDDTVPFRDSFKNLNNSMKNKFGIRSKETVEIVGNVNKEEPAAKTETKKDYKQAEAEGTFNNGFLIVQMDGHWRGLPLYSGNNFDKYTSFMSDLQKAVGKKVHLYSMPIPLASAYYLPSNFSEYSSDQREAIEKVLSKLPKKITGINLIDVLGDHADEDIYLRTDHHWSQIGAFYAGKALAKAADVPYAKKSSYAKIKREGYVGSLYGYTQSANIKEDPETFTILIPSAKYSNTYHDSGFNYINDKDLFLSTDLDNSYLTFIGGDVTPVHVRTEQDNDRKLLIIKDSYGNPLPSLFVSSFEEIYSIDHRYCEFNLPKFIKDQGITDVVTAFSIYTVSNPPESLNNMLTQYTDKDIPNDEPEPKQPSVSPHYDSAKKGEDDLLVN